MEFLKDIMAIKAPAPYEPGEPFFWTDPHISTQMLDAHLDQNTEAASYRFERIDTVCNFLGRRLKLTKGDRLADLGCGPGLYSMRLAGMGCCVTGIDFSRTAIEYARKQADGKDNAPEYRVANYLDWKDTARYHAVLLIYEDFGVLSPQDRSRLLSNIRSAMADGGAFVMDVSSTHAYHTVKQQPDRTWHVCKSGFWSPDPHLVLEERFLYDDVPASCDQYIVYGADGISKVYRIHQTYYSPESITCELEQAGFAVEEVLSNLTGEAWSNESHQIGVICRKR